MGGVRDGSVRPGDTATHARRIERTGQTRWNRAAVRLEFAGRSAVDRGEDLAGEGLGGAGELVTTEFEHAERDGTSAGAT